MKNTLEKPFRHKTFFKGNKLLLWKDFLEWCANYPDCYMGLVADFEKDCKEDNLLDSPTTYHHELRFFDSRCIVKLTEEQADYFEKRRKFYKNNVWYNENSNMIKLSIPEYQEMIKKISNN